MITRPSTPRVLEDVCEQLVRDVLPEITDAAARLRLEMLIAVLNNCANASGSEIALMKEETTLYLEYAVSVSAAVTSPKTDEALAAVMPSDSLLLADVAAEYSRASLAFSEALDAAMDQGQVALQARGEDLLTLRLANERKVLSGSSSLGRSAS